MNRIVSTSTNADFMKHGFQIDATFIGEGGHKTGKAVIDTGSKYSSISPVIADQIGAVDLFRPARVQIADGTFRTLPCHGPGMVILGDNSSLTIRFSIVIVRGGPWDMLVGRDVLTHLLFSRSPAREEMVLAADWSDREIVPPIRPFC